MSPVNMDPETKSGCLPKHSGARADWHRDSRHLPVVLEIHLLAENLKMVYAKVRSVLHPGPLTGVQSPA